MSYQTNEPDVDFSVLSTPQIDKNIRNPFIFLRKMTICLCFTGPIEIKTHASMYFMSICPLAHIYGFHNILPAVSHITKEGLRC